MLTVRCPQCGTKNNQDDIGFPLCSQCQADLVLCASCRHVEGTGCGHPVARARYSGDPNDAKGCPEFRSAHEERRPRMLWQVPAPVWVSFLLLTLLLAIFGASLFIDPAGSYLRGNPLRLETVAPAQVRQGEVDVVKLRVTNLLNRPSTRIYILVDKEFLAEADLVEPQPKPERVNPDRNRFVLEYPPVPARRSMLIKIGFIPRRSGSVTFSAKVYAPSHQLRHAVTVPILVPKIGGEV
ncbi:MAG: hypothetical protein ACYC7E_21685 [Armatimonadota bacterium]